MGLPKARTSTQEEYPRHGESEMTNVFESVLVPEFSKFGGDLSGFPYKAGK